MNDQLQFDCLPPTEHRWAIITANETYRYELGRRWAEGHLLDWVMLNPSTADDDTDDPTIRRCIRFAETWGYAGIRVTNLFAYRATNPRALLAADDPFGPDNNHFLRTNVGPVTIAGWGTHKIVARRAEQWASLFERPTPLRCLGYCADGSPKHPLYMPADSPRLPWPMRVGLP